MHVKNADLHVSYSVPMRVSDTVSLFVVVARADMVRAFVFVPERADVLVAVGVVFFGIKTVTGFVARALTTVFIGVRADTERAFLAFVVVTDLPRVVVFSPRTAPSALNMQNTHAQIKARIFFISDSMLANL